MSMMPFSLSHKPTTLASMPRIPLRCPVSRLSLIKIEDFLARFIFRCLFGAKMRFINQSRFRRL